MTIGLSTFGFVWQCSDQVEKPLDLSDMIAATAMDYGRETLIKQDWKKIFDDSELDGNIARMLKLETAS